NNVFRRLACAAVQSRQRQRCSHQLQTIPARDSIFPNRRLPRKLAMQHLLEGRGSRQLLQAPPVLLALQRRKFFAHLGQIKRRRCRRFLFEFVFAVAAHRVFFVSRKKSSFYRWHVLQLVISGTSRTWYSFTSTLPIAV